MKKKRKWKAPKANGKAFSFDSVIDTSVGRAIPTHKVKKEKKEKKIRRAVFFP